MKRFALFTLVALMGLGMAGCVSAATPTPAAPPPTATQPAAPPPTATQPAAPPPTAPAAALKEVLIGAVYPLSGAAAPTGLDLKNGVELAIDIVNNKYPDLNLPLAKTEGLPNLGGAKLKVVFGDHQAVPEKGLSETERLITSEKVVAVVGAYHSAVTATASQAAERLKVPFLNPESTSPTLIQRDFKWFFRTTPDDEMFAENFFQFLKDLEKTKNIKIKKVAILYENTLWGQDVNKFEDKYAKQYGYEVVSSIAYPAKTAEVTSEVQRLKASGADILLQASYVSDAILFMKTYKQLDYNPDALLAMDAGFIDSAFLKTLGNDGNYIFSREVWALDLATRKPMVKTVNDMYKQRYGTDMNGNSARAFTGILTLADAINRAGSTEPEAIRKALQETNLPGDQLIMPWGGVKFDPKTGQNTLGRGIIVQVQAGAYYTVWPFDLASKEILWPMPKWSARP